VIPKKIFQTHEYKYEELPENYKKTSMSWKILNPGWEYIYHDKDQRAQYVLNNMPEIYNLYKQVKKMNQADIWRYLILNLEGGVYADMDSFCITPMDYILLDLPDHIDVVCTKTEEKEHTNNSNFAAVKGSKILKQCSKDILNAQEIGQNRPNQKIIHDCFTDNIKNNVDIVSKIMTASHGGTYKRDFDLRSIIINYYGKEMPYLDFLPKEI
jgi:mannosyltransferase OCH1-like enzyme